MSKIPVGQGLTFPDETEQATAGVVPAANRRFYFISEGDNTKDGNSPEVPHADPYQNLISVAALQPPVDNANRASIVGSGAFTHYLNIPQFVAARTPDASVLTFTDQVALELNGDHTVEHGTIGNFVANGVCIKSNSNKRIVDRTNAVLVGGTDGIGIEVSGTADDSSYNIVQAELLADGATFVKHTAESETPVNYSAGIVEFFDTNQSLFYYDPQGPSSEVIFNVDAAQPDKNSTTTGSCIAEIKGGVAVVSGDVLAAEKLSDTASGATTVLSGRATTGDNTVQDGGSLILNSIGNHVGDIDTLGDGTCLATIQAITGDVHVQGTSTQFINNQLFIGDITVDAGCTLIAQIGAHIGNLTNNGTIHGWISRQPFGDAVQSIQSYILATWGANLQNAGRFAAINGTADAAQVTGLGVMASAQVPSDGTIDVVNYYSQNGDNTTQFKIIKNGQLVHTFTCDAAYGMETGVGVPVAAGDNVALEYDAGTAPACGIYTMFVD